MRMKTAISLPDEVFRSAEQFAKRARMSRSKLYTKAIAEYIQKHGRSRVTGALDEVYGSGSSAMDAILARMQELSIFNEEW